MVKQFLLLGLTGTLAFAATKAQAQTPVALATSPYVENFSTLANGLPAGFGVYVGATATALGTAPTAAQLILTPGATTAWNNTTGAFKNFASANGLTAAASVADQTAATDRALGVRQTGSFGDPGAAFVFQAANTNNKTAFSLTFNLQSLDNSATVTRTTTWQVDYGIGANPTTFTTLGTGSVTGNMVFSNVPITVNFNSALDNQSGPVTIRVVALNASTGTNSRPSTAIDDFSLSWTAANSNAPTLTTTPGSLLFGNQNQATTSAAQTYSLSAANLTGPTTLAVTGPFTISKDNVTYGTSLTYSAADLATAQTVYVKFAPTAATTAGTVTGSITHTSAGAATKTVTLTGTAVNPNQTTFSFDNCTSTTVISDGWTQYSVTGAQVWACTSFGHDPADATGTLSKPNGVQMNGYASGNVANEDWLISPAFNLTASNFPLFSYWSRTAFAGPALQLRVSTNYTGTGNPNLATWTTLNAQFPASASDVWTQASPVNLSGYKMANVYVAFVYTSTTAAAARWTIDDVALTNSTTAPAPTFFTDVNTLAYGYHAANSTTDKTLTLSANDLTGPVTVTSSSSAYTVSKDGTTFASSVTYTVADLNNSNKTLTVRFIPTAVSTSYVGTLTLATAGATSKTVALSGDTYDLATTLELVNWNMEWFGSSSATLGPTDKNLQQTNATAVLTALKADVYAVCEVVSLTRIQQVVAALSAATNTTYAYMISDFGSYADDANDPDYAECQKLGFIYNTAVVSNPTFVGLLRCTQAQNCPAFNAWASGRFPYMMTATVTLGGVAKQVRFIVIHAKANSTASSANDYARRKLGADLLKAELDTKYPNDNIVLVGDYNDVLNGTIATGVTPAVSSYDSFVQDVTNYSAITLPLANSGAQSTVSYKTVIDNVIASKAMATLYLPASVAVRTDITSTIANYGNTTSDHYPIFSRYTYSNALAAKAASRAQLALYPNPVTNTMRIELPETGSNLSLQVYTTDGRLVVKGTGSVEQLNQQLGQRLNGLSSGLYLIQVVGAQNTYTNRFQKL